LGKKREKPTATQGEGLRVSSSRGDKTRAELFVSGMMELPPFVQSLLCSD
jgi:hypothetical protein